MKKIITMLVLILVLITACSPVKNTQETASDTKVSQPVADELQDYETLKNYRWGAHVENSQDELILAKYALTGWIRYGVDLNSMKPEACLTNRGRLLLKTL